MECEYCNNEMNKMFKRSSLMFCIFCYLDNRNILTDRYRYICNSIIYDKKTTQDLALELNISRERVSQIIRKSLRIINHRNKLHKEGELRNIDFGKNNTRIQKALDRLKINTIDELMKYPANEFLKCRNLGVESIKDILNFKWETENEL